MSEDYDSVLDNEEMWRTETRGNKGDFIAERIAQISVFPVSEADAVAVARLIKRKTGEFHPLVEMLGLVPYVGHDSATHSLRRPQVREVIWTKGDAA